MEDQIAVTNSIFTMVGVPLVTTFASITMDSGQTATKVAPGGRTSQAVIALKPLQGDIVGMRLCRLLR